MSSMKLMAALVGAVLMAGLSGVALAQDNGGGGGGGRFDPAQMRQRMMERMKEQLGSTDDEWKALSPKVEKVMTAQQQMRGGFGGRGPGGGGVAPAADNPVAKAMQDLRTTLENKDATADDIGKKIAALREARDKAKADLAAAQKELKDLLTQRQEAVLIVNGMLE